MRDVEFYAKLATRKAEALSETSGNPTVDGADAPPSDDPYTAAAESAFLDPRWEIK